LSGRKKVFSSMDANITRVTVDTPDFIAYCALRRRLWPNEERETQREAREVLAPGDRWAVFIARVDRIAVGFIEAHLREYAEGASTSPVGFIEGWYVTPDARKNGIGRVLVRAGEDWARECGCTEMGSDTAADNTVSIEAHQRLGYAITERLVSFLKRL
jgi:aminoglycoside 6'-N-acetyltransferase I